MMVLLPKFVKAEWRLSALTQKELPCMMLQSSWLACFMTSCLQEYDCKQNSCKQGSEDSGRCKEAARPCFRPGKAACHCRGFAQERNNKKRCEVAGREAWKNNIYC